MFTPVAATPASVVRSSSEAMPPDAISVAGAPVAVESRQRLPQVAAVLRPAPGGEPVLPVDDPHVEPDGHPLTVRRDRPRAPLAILQRGGAQVDPRAPGGERALQRRVVANAARQLHRDVQA